LNEKEERERNREREREFEVVRYPDWGNESGILHLTSCCHYITTIYSILLTNHTSLTRVRVRDREKVIYFLSPFMGGLQGLRLSLSKLTRKTVMWWVLTWGCGSSRDIFLFKAHQNWGLCFAIATQHNGTSLVMFICTSTSKWA